MKRFFSRWLARWLHTPDENAPDAPGSDIGSDARGTAQDGAQDGAAAHAPMLDCESVMRQLWDYLDGELTPERMAAIRAHLEMCQRCYPQYEFERSFLDAVAASAREHSNQERLRAKLIEALRAKGLGEA